jgi:hypothetical protein
MELPVTASAYEGVKALAAVSNAIERIVFRIQPYAWSGKRCSSLGYHRINHLGCGPIFIDPAAYEIEDPAKDFGSSSGKCQRKESAPRMASDQQMLTVHVRPREQVINDARHVYQRVLEARKSVLGIVRVLRSIGFETFVVESSRLPAPAPLWENDHPAAIIEVLRQSWAGHRASKHRGIISSTGRTMIEHKRRKRTWPVRFERHHL